MAIQLVIPLTNPSAPNAVVITIDEEDLDLVLAHRWQPPTHNSKHVSRVDQRGLVRYLFHEIARNSGKVIGKIRFDNATPVDLRRDNLSEGTLLPVAFPRAYPRPTEEERKLNDPYKEQIDKLRHYLD